MARKELVTSHLLVPLIFLSVQTAEALQCYWCGPLAEQVHRSQRAPSCDIFADHVTACEPGYTHCAVVASSPPFVESRYCVKFYQDECYSLYCNSTKTYRMTCPCRGDLCNGANTQREIEAFSELSKNQGKKHTSKIRKRNAIVLKSNAHNKIVNINEIQSDIGERLHMNNTLSDLNSIETTNDVKNEITDTIKVSKFENDSEIMQSDQPREESKPQMSNHNSIHEQNGHVINESVSAVVKTINDSKTQGNLEETNNMKATESTMETTQMNPVDSYVRHEIKPNMESPTAEALHQKASPLTNTEKPMADEVQQSTNAMITTEKIMSSQQNNGFMTTTDKSSEHHTESTTNSNEVTSTQSLRNSGAVFSYKYLIITKCIIISFII